ncbi:MAG: DedA family protein [Marinilabiliaceae bacterium]|nr:DedA family protein [Marinilabiliaceae bacterium]
MLETTGYVGLFLASFISATIFPMASEGVVVAMVIGGFSPVGVLAVSTVGNWLGSMTTYALGYLGNMERVYRWLRIEEKKTQRWIVYCRRYGSWFGLLVWLPMIGDVIAVCMGLVRSNIFLSMLMILAGKFLRYLFLIILCMRGDLGAIGM